MAGKGLFLQAGGGVVGTFIDMKRTDLVRGLAS
jgi:hypothetical protein